VCFFCNIMALDKATLAKNARQTGLETEWKEKSGE
jgi:hypothetical protein